MSEEPTTTTNTSHHPAKHWAGWVVALLAVPVVYVLAIPPVCTGVTTNWGTTEFEAPPLWLGQMAYPYTWALQNTFLEKPLTLYSEWWREAWMARVPPAP